MDIQQTLNQLTVTLALETNRLMTEQDPAEVHVLEANPETADVGALTLRQVHHLPRRHLPHLRHRQNRNPNLGLQIVVGVSVPGLVHEVEVPEKMQYKVIVMVHRNVKKFINHMTKPKPQVVATTAIIQNHVPNPIVPHDHQHQNVTSAEIRVLRASTLDHRDLIGLLVPDLFRQSVNVRRI